MPTVLTKSLTILLWYLPDVWIFLKASEEEMFIKTQPTTPLQSFFIKLSHWQMHTFESFLKKRCSSKLNLQLTSKVFLHRGTINADNTFKIAISMDGYSHPRSGFSLSSVPYGIPLEPWTSLKILAFWMPYSQPFLRNSALFQALLARSNLHAMIFLENNEAINVNCQNLR